MKTSELIGAQLDWAVAKCEGYEIPMDDGFVMLHSWQPSTDWSQGGPIIEREKIELKENGFGSWFARYKGGKWVRGRTPLIAAMRWFVIDRLGNEVEIPEELK